MEKKKLPLNKIYQKFTKDSAMKQLTLGMVGHAIGRLIEETVYAKGRAILGDLESIGTSITPFFFVNTVNAVSETFITTLEERSHEKSSGFSYRLTHVLRYLLPMITLAGYVAFEATLNSNLNSVRSDPLFPDIVSASAGTFLSLMYAEERNREANERLGYKTYSLFGSR